MSSKSAQNTSDTFRLLYVLAIFMVVDGHIGSYDYLSLNGIFPYQNYHIALFFFVSGYFIKLHRGFIDFIFHKFIKLILPFYLWNFVYAGVSYYLNHYHGFSLGDEITFRSLFYMPIIDGHQYIYNMASWFLIPLFWVQTISFLILKPFYLERKTLNSLVLYGYLLMALFLGYTALLFSPVNAAQKNFFLMCIRTFYFLPFYAFGIFYRHIFEKHDTLNTPLYLLLILTATIVLRIIFPYSDITPSWLDLVQEPIGAIYAVSLLAILFWLRIARIFTPIVKQSKTLNYIATHTFDIMMHHFVGFMLAKAVLSPWGNLNQIEFKSSIWYYHFPFGEILTTPIYIVITLVIALFIGFTSRKICHIIGKIISGIKFNRKKRRLIWVAVKKAVL